jgi:hypothetical protein
MLLFPLVEYGTKEKVATAIEQLLVACSGALLLSSTPVVRVEWGSEMQLPHPLNKLGKMQIPEIGVASCCCVGKRKGDGQVCTFMGLYQSFY